MRFASLAALALSLIAPPALADSNGQGKKEPRNEQTLEQVLQEAASAGERPGGHEEAAASGEKSGTPTTPPAETRPAEKNASPTSTAGKDAKTAGQPAGAAPPGGAAAAPAAEQAPATDDNDATGEAAAPTALRPVAPTTQPRVRGPYELGALDCRVLDGAGIERVLPRKLTAGEEPDLLCRILVTQPPNVATLSHQLTFNVTVGERETYRQVRNVRISSIGRRALVFVVPADRIATDASSSVRIHASLSAPAQPAAGQTVKFTVETED